MEADAIMSSRRRARALSVTFALLLFCPAAWSAQSVTAAWSPSRDSTVVGYRVYYGTASGAYSSWLEAGTNTTITIPDLQEGTTYYLAAVSYDDAGIESVLSNEASYTVPVSVAPAIISPPASRTNVAGTAASFTVAASGTAPLSYQWLKGESALAGATSTTLTLANVTDGDAGGYSVVITNVAGAVTSSVAVLTVLDAPLITSQPASVTIVAGTTAAFTVVASGTAPLSYQWFKGASALAGATSTTLTLANVADADAGSYIVVVTDLAGSVTSSVAALTVLDAPLITSPPASLTNVAGTTASFTVVASGTAPLSYQWFKGASALAGATSTTLTLANVTDGDAGGYLVVITNVAGAVTSSAAALTVLDAPLITSQPVSVTNVAGTTATFAVVASGTAPLSYQWFQGASALAGATGTTLTLANVADGDAGSYSVVVTNLAGSVTSSVATLTVIATSPPSLTAYPKRSFTDPLKLTFAANPDHWYELQATTDLSNWSTIWQTTNLTTTAVLEFDDNDVGFVARFYRLVEH